MVERPMDPQDIQALFIGQKQGYNNATEEYVKIIDKTIKNIEEAEPKLYKGEQVIRILQAIKEKSGTEYKR